MSQPKPPSFLPPQRHDSHRLFQIPRTTSFIADGSFRRVALQFPDTLLREAPEVLWTLQARLRKLAAGGVRSASQEGCEEEGEGKGSSEVATAAPPLIFVTGDTSYGSCCVDEVSAQHLKADAIVHYGENYCKLGARKGCPVRNWWTQEHLHL